jgi:hypothetical protein
MGSNDDSITLEEIDSLIAKEKPAPSWMKTIQPEAFPIPDAIKENTLIKYALHIAEVSEFPAGSTLFTALGAFSAACSMVYSVKYQDGERLPLGLYVAVEQPPATAKSRVLSSFMRPLNKCIGALNAEIHKEIKAAKSDDNLPPYIAKPLSNATAEGIETEMAKCCSGRFIIASAEQGAANHILAIDAKRTSDKDLILKGYNGEYHHSIRATRNGFSGDIYGSVILIAQVGMTRKILKASGGEGLAERFLFLSEPHLLGKRTHRTPHKNYLMEADYFNRVQSLITQFNENDRPLGVENTIGLSLSDEGYNAIQRQKITIEPMLADYANRGAMLLCSALGKFDIHAMKTAAILFIADHCMKDGGADGDIPLSYVEQAIEVIMLQFKQLERIMDREGESGEGAKREAVLRKFKTRTSRKKTELATDLKNVKPFKHMPEPYKAAIQTIEAMLSDGELYSDPYGSISPA